MPRSIIRHVPTSQIANALKHGYGRRSSTRVDIARMLQKPTWSVRSILSSPTAGEVAPTIAPKQLHHLLRLSALPLPDSESEEKELLEALNSHIRFVKEIQSVDTTGVTPLRALQDETQGADLENTIDMKSLTVAFDNEEIVGKHFKRIRRTDDTSEVDTWDVTGYAERTAGKHFVVQSEKPGSHD